MPHGKIGTPLAGFSKLRHGVFGAPILEQDETELVVGIGIIGVDGKRGFEVPLSFRYFTGIEGQNPQLKLHSRIAGIHARVLLGVLDQT
jgi:hypothetical protein